MPDTPPSDAGSTKGRKARTKTFSGCWTCRAKHVKCDETRPVCNRCRRSGLACEGYGVRLSWTSVRGPSNFRSRSGAARRVGRMQVERPFQFQEPGATDHQPTAQQPTTTAADERHNLRESTVASEGSTQADTSNSGLGSVLDSDSPGRDGNPRPNHTFKVLGQSIINTAADTPYPAPQQVQVQQQQQQQQPQQHQQQAQQSQRQQRGDRPADASGQQQQDPKSSAESYQDITWLPQCATPPSASHLNYRNQQVNIPNPGTHIRHLDVLPNPGIQCQLLEHWTLHLCDALNPVPGVHNPLRTIMMPIALEGARADVNSSTGATALFHLICSASAFSLAQKGTTPESQRELESAALEHHNLGITHLGQNIQSDDRSQCVPLLASLVMCIYNEVITVPTPFWRLHFRGAVEWVNHISPQVWHQTEGASVIYQMFIGMATLVQSQLFLGPHEDHMWEIPFDQLSQPGPYSLDMAFGMPQHVMQCLQSMNKSLMEARRSAAQGAAASPSTTQDFDRLEVELYLSAPTRPSATIGKEYGDLIYHHGYTFYFAALIFMKRTVKDTPIEDVQALIAQSLSHVEALEASTDRPFCPMLWPIAILAFEACDVTLQNRMLKCLEMFADRSGFAIWNQLESLVRDLWELRKAEGNPNLKWHKSVLTSINDSFMLL